MDALHIQKAHILGISMGGMIAEEFVLNYPQKVDKLVLCSTNCGATKSIPPSAEVISVLIKPREGRSEEDIVKDTIPFLLSEDFIKKNPESVDIVIKNILKIPTSPKTFQRQLNAIMRFDSYEKLNNISKPTLIMHGKKDILVPPQNGEIIAGRIPNAKIKLFDDSAHALFAQETDPVINALVNFLQGR
jgi:pimeloyl-ACP methyl ester carboxylesterase